MSELQPVTLVFKDKEYKVEKEDNIWGLIEAIEDVVTLLYLAPRLQNGQVPAAKIFRAYAAALNFAGAQGVTPDEIRKGVDYKRMFQMANELATILLMGMPPADVDIGEVSAPEKSVDKAKKKAGEK